MEKLNLADIQGFVLRGYRMPMARHYLLKVNDPVAARALLGKFVNGDELAAPQITTAEEWRVGFSPGPFDQTEQDARPKPDYCLNVGITWNGMVALGLEKLVPEISFKSFDAFVSGAGTRAESVGDTGINGPEHWIGGFGSGDDHVMFTLHCMSMEVLRKWSLRLTSLFKSDNAFEVLWHGDGMALLEMQDGKPVPVSKVHFGYTDGITLTPNILGGPERHLPDGQEPCEPWLFVLLDEAENYYLPQPPALGLNGSFGVFKMMKQDVAGFEAFLQSHKDQIDPELLAAKLCGRWRNGVPLSRSPESHSPPESPFNAIIGFSGGIGWAIGHPPSDESVTVVASPGATLARHGLPTRIDSANMGPDRTANPSWIASPILVHIAKIIQFFRRDSRRPRSVII